MPKKRQSRTPLRRERVLAAALTLADAHGLDALTMRRLGAELGVEAMSLYNHVANKDDILDGLVELVVSEIEVPSDADPDIDWKQAMRGRALSSHAALLRHPWACGLMMSRPNVGPNMLRYVESTLGTLRRAGFPIQLVDHAWNALDSHIYGFTLQALNFPFDPDEYAAVATEYLPSIPVEDFPYLNELTREVVSGRYDGLHDFAFGLDFILDGLERQLESAKRETT